MIPDLPHNIRKLIGVQSNHGVEYIGGPVVPIRVSRRIRVYFDLFWILPINKNVKRFGVKTKVNLNTIKLPNTKHLKQNLHPHKLLDVSLVWRGFPSFCIDSCFFKFKRVGVGGTVLPNRFYADILAKKKIFFQNPLKPRLDLPWYTPWWFKMGGGQIKGQIGLKRGQKGQIGT